MKTQKEQSGGRDPPPFPPPRPIWEFKCSAVLSQVLSSAVVTGPLAALFFHFFSFY